MALGSGEGLANRGRPLKGEIKDESPGKYPFDEWKMSSTRNPARRAKVARAIGAKGAEIEGASGITDAFHDARPLMPPTGEVWALDDPLLASTESRYPRAREFAFAPGSVGSVGNPWFSERRWTVGKGLVAAYTMNAGSGTVLRDDSGNFNDAMIVGPTWTSSGKSGYGLSFTTNDYVTIPAKANRLYCGGAGTAFTVALWVKPTSATPGVTGYILGKSGATLATNNNISIIQASTTGYIVIRLRNGTLYEGAQLTTDWAHIAITWDETTAKYYKDGAWVADINVGTVTDAAAFRPTLGCRWNDAGTTAAVFFEGVQDEFRLYEGRALSATEVASLYTETSPYTDVYEPPCDNAIWMGKTTTNLVATTDLNDSTKWNHSADYHTNQDNVFDSELQKTVWKWNKGGVATTTYIYDSNLDPGGAGLYSMSIMIKCNYALAVVGFMYGTTQYSSEQYVPANAWTLCTFYLNKAVDPTGIGFQIQSPGVANFAADIEFRACDPYVALESYPMPFVPTTRPAGSLWYNYEWPQQGTVGFWVKPGFNVDVGTSKYFISDYNGAWSNLRAGYSSASDKFFLAIAGTTSVTIYGTAITSNADLQKWWFISLTYDIPNDSLKLYCYNEDYPGGDIASSSSDLGTVTFEPYLSVGGIPLYTSPAGYEADSLIGGLFIDDTVWTEASLKAHYEGKRGFTLGGATSSGRGGFENASDRVFLQDINVGSRDATSRIRMKAETGEVWAQGVYEKTTASGANVYVGNDFKLLRSTSSERYKKDIEDLDPKVLDRVLALRPVWYRSNAPYDNPSWSWYGLLAEEVARVDPRLVTWGRPELGPVPEGVDYARLSVMVLALIQRLSARYDHEMDAMGTRVAGILAGIELLRDRVPLIEKRVNDILDRIVILEKEVEDVKARLAESSPVIVEKPETK